MALQELTIRNFAIIKQLDIELNKGLTVVTGETGAGKSIVVEALNLLLGLRADLDMIRHDQEQCEITALFAIADLSQVKAWLSERDLLSDDPNNDDTQNYCLIRRVIRRNKPTRCYINDQPATLASLRDLGILLVDLHGQHEHQSLLRLQTQRQIIDQFANHPKELEQLAKLSATIHRLQQQLTGLTQTQSDNSDRLELLSFQLNELDEASILDGEFEELEQELSRLENAQNLINGIKSAIDSLYQSDNDNISTNLGNKINNLSELLEFDSRLKEPHDLLNSSLALLDDAQAGLEAALSKIEQDPQKLSEVEQRVDTIINLARKHRCKEIEISQRHAELQNEYERIKGISTKPEKIQLELVELTKQYSELAQKISTKRQQVAADLSAKITLQMQDLGMQGGSLNIQVTPRTGEEVYISEYGIDQIEYLVSTNQGVPFKSLQKTASGGELSRISLAIQVITSAQSDTPTLVFDEVDVGVGGKIASMIGRRLRELGKNAQIICITHQPQVASQGHQHLYVDKVIQENETYSTLIVLKDQMRTDEIARMLSGDEITERTRAHAKEMLVHAESI